MENNQPKDRRKGHVWLECEGKYWISGVFTVRDMRSVRRVFYAMCKKLHLHPKKIKIWGRSPLLGFRP